MKIAQFGFLDYFLSYEYDQTNTIFHGNIGKKVVHVAIVKFLSLRYQSSSLSGCR